MPKGKITRTEPAVGQKAPVGSTVTYWVSTGPASVQVPNLVGKSEADARAALTQAGLIVKEPPGARCSDDVQVGQVAKQGTPDGHARAEGQGDQLRPRQQPLHDRRPVRARPQPRRGAGHPRRPQGQVPGGLRPDGHRSASRTGSCSTRTSRARTRSRSSSRSPSASSLRRSRRTRRRPRDSARAHRRRRRRPLLGARHLAGLGALGDRGARPRAVRRRHAADRRRRGLAGRRRRRGAARRPPRACRRPSSRGAAPARRSSPARAAARSWARTAARRQGRSTSSSRCSTARSARTARSRACSRRSACPTSAPACSARRRAWTRRSARRVLRDAGIAVARSLVAPPRRRRPARPARRRARRRGARLAGLRQAREPRLERRHQQGARPRGARRCARARLPPRREGARRGVRRRPRARVRRARQRPPRRLRGRRDPDRRAEWYDYSAKYDVGGSDLAVPADIPAPVAEQVRAIALAAFRALELSGMARVDFFWSEAGERARERGQHDPGIHRHVVLRAPLRRERRALPRGAEPARRARARAPRAPRAPATATEPRSRQRLSRAVCSCASAMLAAKPVATGASFVIQTR